MPIDFSENSIRAARYAATIASQFGAEITLLHIIGAATFAKESSYLGFTEIGASGGAERRLSLLAKRNIPQGVTVKSVVETGIAFDTILEAARTMGSDLIIAAARCHPDAESPQRDAGGDGGTRGPPCALPGHGSPGIHRTRRAVSQDFAATIIKLAHFITVMKSPLRPAAQSVCHNLSECLT